MEGLYIIPKKNKILTKLKILKQVRNEKANENCEKYVKQVNISAKTLSFQGPWQFVVC